jgi:hypothetical protein
LTDDAPTRRCATALTDDRADAATPLTAPMRNRADRHADA